MKTITINLTTLTLDELYKLQEIVATVNNPENQRIIAEAIAELKQALSSDSEEVTT